jgi:hypothetical protein
MLNNFKAILLIAALTLAGAGLHAQDTSNLPKPQAVEAVRAKLGNGPDEVGREQPFGPPSFVDSGNARIQVFKNNKRIKTIPLNLARAFPVDIDLLPDKKIVLMDNMIINMVFILDEKGRKLKEFKLAGGGVSDPATVNGVYVVNQGQSLDGIWVDNNGTSVRLADLKGNPDPDRPLVWGRFTLVYNRQMRADRAGDFTAQVDTSDLGISASGYQEYPLTFDTYLHFILGLDADDNGHIYILTHHSEESKGKITDQKNIVTILSPNGDIEKRFLIYFPHVSEIAYRSLRVSPDGKVYYMTLDDKGLCVRLYDPWGD